MNNKFKNVLTLGGFIIFAIIIAFLLPKREEAVVLQDTASKSEYNDIYENNLITQTEDLIYVHVMGAVHEPGVVKAPIDSRLYEILDLVGGATNEADLEKLNLASIVKDAQKIIVPYCINNESGEVVLNKNYIVQEHNGLININTADQSMLESLDGIGSSTAKKIIKYREESGMFNSIEDLMNVTGIGENKFNAIKDDITV